MTNSALRISDLAIGQLKQLGLAQVLFGLTREPKTIPTPNLRSKGLLPNAKGVRALFSQMNIIYNSMLTCIIDC